MKTHALISIALATLSAGCGISVEGDVPDVEITQRGVVFKGVPGASLAGDQSMAKSFSQKHKKLELADGHFSGKIKYSY